MQLQRSYNRLRLYLKFPLDLRANRKTLGMQPELQYPRRSRFAPIKVVQTSEKRPLLLNLSVGHRILILKIFGIFLRLKFSPALI